MGLLVGNTCKYRIGTLFIYFISGLFTAHADIDNLSKTSLPSPQGLQYSVNPQDTPEKKLNSLLGIRYRIDGAIDQSGNYTLFSKPETRLKTPGLNCSGFVLEASRFLLNDNIAISAAKHDRLNDSGKNSPFGKDWDFGWDLILNIAEGHSASLILPNGERRDASDPEITGFSPRGFDLHSPKTWAELPDRLKPHHLYLISFNRDSRKPNQITHYHVGLIYVNNPNEIWLYQTTGKSQKVYRRNLADKKQRDQFLRSFANSGNLKKYILILEIPLA